MRLVTIILYIVYSAFAFAQDTMSVLTYDDFMQAVLKHHPAYFQANLRGQQGDAELLRSKGGFDPNLYGNINQKYFNDKQYYSNLKGGLEIPTWFGITADAGYILNDGDFINPERSVPSAGLWYAGLRVELGKGLIIDQRRAELQKAKIYQASSYLQQRILLNQLKRDASFAYWNWRKAYENVKLYSDATLNATERFNAVKESAKFGDRPFIDTTEAYMLVQNRTINLSKARANYLNAEAYLELFLWSEGFVPLELTNTIPDLSLISVDQSNLMVPDSLIQNHPYLLLAENKVNSAEIDLKYKREQLKPKLSLKYNALAEPINNNPMSEFTTENYMWGASFAYPILTRSERGSAQVAKYKLQHEEINYEFSKQEIEYKIIAARNNLSQAIEQLLVARAYRNNANVLFDAEKELFNLGESSVFMINSRENSLLKAEIDLIDISNQCKVYEAEVAYQLMLLD